LYIEMASNEATLYRWII